MEVGSAIAEKAGFLACSSRWFKSSLEKFTDKVIDISRNIKHVGQDDPRRVIHSLKAGLALTLVSIFYYYQPLYKNFGDSAMWAVITVVVVFEFSVGATIGKGVNRGIATFLAGALGLGAYYLANLCGHIGEPILIGIFVFLQAAISTFIRFFPKIKARYDYGLLIFILTFSLVSISGLRYDEVLELAQKRLSTIIIGGSACVIISIVVFPVWGGQDLHNLTALNLEKLGNFLEGFGDEYFKTKEDGETKHDKSFLQGYKSVLNSKSAEESLANFARWEPPHGHFRFRHPWKLYLKIGTLIRQCAYRIEALNGYLCSDVQAASEIGIEIQEACMEVSVESGKALKELALAAKAMTTTFSADSHIENAKSASKNLKSLLKSGQWEGTDLLRLVPLMTAASILVDIVECVETIAKSVHELAAEAHFERVDPGASPEKLELGKLLNLKLDSKVDCRHVIVPINEEPPAISRDENSQK